MTTEQTTTAPKAATKSKNTTLLVVIAAVALAAVIGTIYYFTGSKVLSCVEKDDDNYYGATELTTDVYFNGEGKAYKVISEKKITFEEEDDAEAVEEKFAEYYEDNDSVELKRNGKNVTLKMKIDDVEKYGYDGEQTINELKEEAEEDENTTCKITRKH